MKCTDILNYYTIIFKTKAIRWPVLYVALDSNTILTPMVCDNGSLPKQILLFFGNKLSPFQHILLSRELAYNPTTIVMYTRCPSLYYNQLEPAGGCVTFIVYISLNNKDKVFVLKSKNS